VIPNSYKWSILSKLIIIFYSLFVLKVTSVYLPEKEFSNFYLLTNAAIYLMPVFFGMQGAIVLRFYHHSKMHLQSMISTFNWIALISIILLTIFMNYFYSSSYIVSLYVVGLGIYHYLVSKLRAQHNFRKMAVYAFIHLIITFSIILIFIESNSNAIFLLLVISISYVLISLKSTYHDYKEINVKNIDISMLRYAAPLVFLSVFNSTLSSMDQYFLYYFGYEKELSGYIANYNIGEKIIFSLLGVIVTVFVPIVFKKYQDLTLSAINEIYTILIKFLVLSIFLVLVMYFLSDYLVLFFTDEKYIDTAWIIPIIGFGAMILGMASIGAEVFTIKKTTNILLRVYFSGFLINFFLNIFFIPNYGIIGAIISTICSYLIMLLYVVFLITKERKKLTEVKYYEG
jgi:O-antigen/teichoic acid export membrane protein